MGTVRENSVGLAVLCFDTAEYLPVIARLMLPVTGGMTVCFPYTSYGGLLPQKKVEREVMRTVLSDERIRLFRPEVRFMASAGMERRELTLRNLVLERMDEDGWDYTLFCDSDEIYFPGEFTAARDAVLSSGWDAAYCRYVDYYKYPDVMITAGGGYVPLLQRSGFRYSRKASYDVRVDSSRRILFDDTRTVGIAEGVTMHHLSWVRASIRDKLSCWSGGENVTAKQISEFNSFYKSFVRPRTYNTPVPVRLPSYDAEAVRVWRSELKKIIE